MRLVHPIMARPVEVDALYRTHSRLLYAFIYHRVGNREAAEDITSDVFVSALQHLDPTREERSVIAWLYRVARNAVTDYWRAGHDTRIIAFDDAQVARLAPPAPTMTAPGKAAARAARLLAQLPENYRTVLDYRVLQGLSVAETAQRMGISTANVKVLQHRALKRATQLREDDDQDG